MNDDEYNRVHSTSKAKHSKAEHSKESNADNNAINIKLKYLLNNTAKNTNWKFRRKVEASKKDPVAELERRVLARLRPMYGWDNFKELMFAIAKLTPFEKMKYLRELENSLNKKDK
tara:strand:+ start:376 stop:723 length:348 start_codon:yes stop_codon:yes gene_type:complete